MEKEDYERWGPELARSVLRNVLLVKKGENVMIEAWTSAIPWLHYFLVETRKIGANPIVIYDDDEAFWKNVEEGRAKSIGTLGSHELAALKETNAYVYFWGPADRKRWHKLSETTLKDILAYEDEWFNNAKEKGMRFCRLEIARVTKELAAEYKIDYSKWMNEILEASLINPEPMVRQGRKIAEKLEVGREILISHKNGTKLQLRLKGRKPFVDDGVIDETDIRAGHVESTIPSGVVSVAVDETFGEGTIIGNKLTRHGPSRGESDRGRWRFEEGRLVNYSYGRGARDFTKIYRAAGNERDRIGIFSIGLNPKLHVSPLFEDQELGTVSIYVGSNDWLGGATRGSFRSWLLLTGADVFIDGEQILKNGKII